MHTNEGYTHVHVRVVECTSLNDWRRAILGSRLGPEYGNRSSHQYIGHMV